ncbi:MAG: membrane protein insertion efficiency factor YidD [Propionibacteriaceae bacterium]|jgi:putative membrane protein insertion efficiency factor|nr:membrane protein insertion efficiency factor YidD [Propionibacteriaceae bacterium]
MKWILIGFIKAWRAILSPWYGNVCKYYPTCSAYGLEAVQTHGAAKGAGLIVWRILRCNPWSKGGYDPVPGTQAAREWAEEQAATALARSEGEVVCDYEVAAKPRPAAEVTDSSAPTSARPSFRPGRRARRTIEGAYA